METHSVQINDIELAKDIKEKIKEQRERNHITQIDISNKLYKTRQYFSNIESTKGENATKLPLLLDFIRICQILNITPDYLLGFQPIENTDVYKVSQYMNMCEESIVQLKNEIKKREFIDYLLKSNELDIILNEIPQLKIETIAYIRPLYTIYTETIIQSMNKHFDEFVTHHFYTDITYNHVRDDIDSYYTEKQFDYQKISLLLTDEGLTYYNHLSLEKYDKTFDCLDFNTKKKFFLDTFVEDYLEFKMKEFEHQKRWENIKETLPALINKYIDEKIVEFDQQARKYAQNHKNQ